ncbi:MAG TPA: hypothetical protein VE650_16400 [Acetobacteraceae bacterium]|nr:hypothetical protein [Acetobacteraceae bacterium]
MPLMPGQPKLRSYYGTIVSGADFWPRPEIVDPLVRSLRRGQSHTLFGLRRTGKSSIMAEASQRLIEQGVLVSQINAEGGKGIEDVFGALLRRLPAPDYRTSLLRHIEKANTLAAPVLGTARRWLDAAGITTPAASERDTLDYWPALSDALLHALQANERPVALFIDELPFLIENTVEVGSGADRAEGLAVARNILVTLREWRGLKHVAMLVAGSIGMRGLALRHGLDPGAFNDMLPVNLPPLTEGEAKRMVGALVAGTEPPVSGWTEDSTLALLAGVPDFYPGFLQLAFQCVADRGVTAPATIGQALHNHFAPQLGQQFFSQFENRLRREKEPLRSHMLAAIDLAVDNAPDGGAALDAVYDALTALGCELPEEVTSILQEDGFLLYDAHGGRLRPAGAMITAWRNATPRKRRR